MGFLEGCIVSYLFFFFVVVVVISWFDSLVQLAFPYSFSRAEIAC
jgi:hypothetical protein